jgi:FkbM family methyltransferase
LLLKLIKKIILKTKLSKKVIFAALSTESAFERIIHRGINVNTVIDIGASDGSWSKTALQYFPKAEYLLIEALQQHEPDLKKFVKKYKNTRYELVAAGDKEGEVYFESNTLYDGKALKEPATESAIRVPVNTIDNLVKENALEAPFMIKLDTHGFEVPILEGAIQTLKNTDLLVIETYNFKITDESLRFHEMIAYMENKGFRCIDISEPLFRSRDDSFWQIDLFFVKSKRKEFEINTYE